MPSQPVTRVRVEVTEPPFTGWEVIVDSRGAITIHDADGGLARGTSIAELTK